MSDRLSLLRLYLEWGVDESLASTCTNHFETTRPLTTVIPSKKSLRQSTTTQSTQHTNHHDILKAQNLEEICKLINAFKECPLHDTAMHSVLPQGNPNASIFLIGEVPDADEDRSGQIFHGTSAFWLKQLFHSINKSMDDCFCMPIIPWRPPGGRQVSPNELNLCLPFLYKILEIYKPKFIITVGLLPAQILLQQSLSFSSFKGKWHHISLPKSNIPLTFFPLRHPYQINASAKIRKETWQDLLKIRSAIESIK